MERIESLDSSQFSGRSSRKRARRSKLPRLTAFSSLVEEAGEEQGFSSELRDEPERRRSLEAALDEVHERGERLVQSPTLQHIKEYRQAVRSFLDFVVAHLLVVEEKTSGASVKKRKRFTQLRVIDQRLEQLVTAVLQNQVRQLDMLERVNEIRGLLVDLIT